jgi:hypothetical protein
MMKIFSNIMMGRKYRGGWTKAEAVAHFGYGVARELHIAPRFFYRLYRQFVEHTFNKKWLKRKGNESYFDFHGAILPDVSNDRDKYQGLFSIFEEVFLVSCYHNDNYSKVLLDRLELFKFEGAYGYTDGHFDVTVKKGDIVVDAGAWIGDFSAYSASKGAIAYAFEPAKDTFQWLSKMAMLNNVTGGGGNLPYPKRLKQYRL